MKISQLIDVAQSKLIALNQAIATATSKGDAEALPRLDAEVAETQATLDSLRAVL